jgi:hypothetical protein
LGHTLGPTPLHLNPREGVKLGKAMATPTGPWLVLVTKVSRHSGLFGEQ